MIRRLMRLLGLLEDPDLARARSMSVHPAGHDRPLESVPPDGMCRCELCFAYWDQIFRSHELHDLAILARALDWPA